MTTDDIAFASASDLAAWIRSGELRACDAVDAMLRRIDALNPNLHAYLHVCADRARERAEAADRALASGAALGPLHGVPVAVKDLFDTAGVPTTCGSRILAGRVPGRSATVVERLEHAGAIVLGMTHMTEFAHVAHHPDTPNPWASDKSPGGSSSGSAIAVASGLCAAALGSDTIASIRLPAAWCGAVGLKPTWGRVSRDGVFPLAASFDHVGPITRTVADAARVLACIAGSDPRDPTAIPQPAPALTPARRDDLSGVRIGWDEAFVAEDTHEDVLAATRAAREAAEDRGAEIVPIEIPLRAEVLAAFGPLFAQELQHAHADFYPERSADYGPCLRAGLAATASAAAADYVEASLVRRAFQLRIAQLFGDLDALLTPVVAWPPAPRMADSEAAPIPDPGPAMAQLMRFTSLWNLAGAPAIALPWGRNADGLPLAIQLIAAPARDDHLLSLAAVLESLAPNDETRPPLAREESP